MLMLPWIRLKKRGSTSTEATAPLNLRYIVDKKRTPSQRPSELPQKRRFVLRESAYSRRRLRPLIILVAVLLVIVGLGTAWYLNKDYKMQAFAQKTVFRMASAPSYRATGLDTTTDAGSTKEVREQFSYVAPDSVQTRYLTSARQPGSDMPVSIGCRDQEIIIIASTRYQRCNDPDADPKGWRTDSYNTPVFDTTLFQPWTRYSWVKKIKEEEETQQINGVPTRIFSGRVPNEREAATIWSKAEGLSGKGVKSAEARARFIRDAVVDITVWVREEDGYIARFLMNKTVPGLLGSQKETVDYVYSDFGQVSPIAPPDTSKTSQVGSGQQQSALGQPPAAARPSLALINGYTFRLEVADDDATRGRGLAKRTFLSQDTAMLFAFPKEDRWLFWMKDTSIPLDILFLDSNRVIVDIQTMQPEPGTPDSRLRRYQPGVPALYALEINAGIAQENRFQTGMVVELRGG